MQCLKDPLSLHGFETNLNSKDNVSITVTKFIQGAEKCVESDQVASPRVEMIRRVTGLEYEFLQRGSSSMKMKRKLYMQMLNKRTKPYS